MLSVRPILRIDPGWLYVIAGLAMCAAAILVPARADLDQVRRQELALQAIADHGERRLEARLAFLDQLDRRDPTLLRRLAAAQLNLMPAGSEPVLATATRSAAVADWLDAAVTQPDLPVEGEPTMLMRLTQGRRRPWFAGAAVLFLFVGLLSSFTTTLSPRLGKRAARRPVPRGPGAARCGRLVNRVQRRDTEKERPQGH